MKKALKFFVLAFILQITGRLVVNFFQADNPVLTYAEIAELVAFSAILSVFILLMLKYDKQ